jgi:hypothetical protein
MAYRPVFVPKASGISLVEEVSLPLVWSPGFAPIQKAKNIKALHESARHAGYAPVLEISTKSEEKLGRHLSAFHLKVQTPSLGEIPLECAFQGSKVFKGGGPFTDLYRADVRAAKKDPRLRSSGELIGFSFQGQPFPLTPPTMFYDWLYLGAIYIHREYLVRLQRYAAFSDIEFNPEKSINCQARSCALFVSLTRRSALESAMTSASAFRDLLASHNYGPIGTRPRRLFPTG